MVLPLSSKQNNGKFMQPFSDIPLGKGCFISFGLFFVIKLDVFMNGFFDFPAGLGSHIAQSIRMFLNE